MRNYYKKHMKVYALFYLLMAWIGIENVLAQEPNSHKWDGVSSDQEWLKDYATTNYFEISTPEQLKGLADFVNQDPMANNKDWGFKKKTIRLTNDIDLNNHEWESIGKIVQREILEEIEMVGTPFMGTFDGNGHSIKGLKIDKKNKELLGLFACIAGAVIKNLTVEGTISGYSTLGGIVAYDYGPYSQIENCHSAVNITSKYGGVGGIVSNLGPGCSIKGCYNSGTIEGGTDKSGAEIGGIVSRLGNGSTVSGCINVGNLIVDYENSPTDPREDMGSIIGGIVAFVYYDATIENCCNLGDIRYESKREDFYIGGIVGCICQNNANIFSNFSAGAFQIPENLSPHISALGNAFRASTPVNVYYCFYLTGGIVKKPFSNTDKDNLTGLGLPIDEIVEKIQQDWILTSYPWAGEAQLVNGKIYAPAFNRLVYSEGNFLIRSASELISLRDMVKGDASKRTVGCDFSNNTFKQTVDIDLENMSWIPIGTSDHPFGGKYDGAGHVVSGLYIDAASKDNQGLFGYLKGENAEIKNLGVVSRKQIKGHENVGGLVGYNQLGKIRDCYFLGGVVGSTNVGGLVGVNTGQVQDCYNVGNVRANQVFGGVVGLNEGQGSVTGTRYLSGTVSNSKGIGNLDDTDGQSTEVDASALVTEMNKTLTTEKGWNIPAKLEDKKLYMPVSNATNLQIVDLCALTVDLLMDGKELSETDKTALSSFADFYKKVYPKGTIVTLTPQEEVNKSTLFDTEMYEFLTWSKNPVEMSNAEVKVTANFRKHVYRIEKEIMLDGKKLTSGDDYEALNPCISIFDESVKGKTIPLSLAGYDPASYMFVDWTVNTIESTPKSVKVTPASGQNPTTFEMPGKPVKVTANFKKYYKVELVKPTELAYDGKAKEVRVKFNDVFVTDGFTIAYDDNVNAGKVKATVTFTEPLVYIKNQTVEYDITPIVLTVIPDAKQVVYVGEDYTFSFKTAGEIDGEQPNFSGALAGSNGVITQGDLSLKDGPGFLAKNYTLKLREVKYTQNSTSIEEKLDNASDLTVIDETESGESNDKGWYSRSKGLIYTIPAGFEVSLDGKEWHRGSLNFTKEGEYTETVILRRVNSKQTKTIRLAVKLDYTAPRIELDHINSLNVYFRVWDDVSGVLRHEFESLFIGLRSTELEADLRSTSDLLVWRGKEGTNRLSLKVSDHAGNVMIQEFSLDLTYKGWNVVLPENPWAYIVPDPGTYDVENEDSFVFRLEPRRGYSLENIKVSVENGDEIQGEKGRYTIPSVTSDMNIKIEYYSPTGTEEIEITEFSVRMNNGAIVIATPTATDVQIVDFNGRILRSFRAPAGTTYCTGYAKGAYIVRSEFGTVKIVL